MIETVDLITDTRNRREKLREMMRLDGADACLIASNLHIFYLTGSIFAGVVYLHCDGTERFFVRRPVGMTGSQIRYIRKPEQIPDLLEQDGLPLPKVVWLEGDELSYGEWARLSQVIPGTRCVQASARLRTLRSVKTTYEQAQLIESGRRHALAYQKIPSFYRPGITDEAWTIELEREMRLNGCLGLFRIAGQSMEAFMGSTLTGDNAGAPSPYDFALGGAGMHPSLPIGQNGTVLKPGQTIMFDMGGNFTGYMTDMSRVFAIGHVPSEALRAHQVSMEIHQALSESGKPGKSGEALYDLAMDMVSAAGLSDYFMGLSQKARFVGHGVGLVVNELPVLGAKSRDVLEEGMCIAVEPKFVLPSIGAVGPEDTYIVRSWGMERITPGNQEIVVI